MNLVFAMDEQTIRKALRDGDIALCPIRQMGKSTILLQHIFENHRDDLIVYVLAPHYEACNYLDQMWVKMTKGINPCPNLVTKPRVEYFERASQGRASAPVYVDEYMLCLDMERLKLHRLANEAPGLLRFCGGVATFRC